MTTADSARTLRARAGELLSPLRLSSYRRLWSADMISLLGDWAARLALAVVVYDRTGSAAWAAAVTAVSLAGFVGLGQALATLADRYGRIAVMIVADLVRAACFAAMLLLGPCRRSLAAGVSGRLGLTPVRGGEIGGAARPRARGPLRACRGPLGHLRAGVAGARVRVWAELSCRSSSPRSRSV